MTTTSSGASTSRGGASTSIPSATTPTATTAADPTPAQAGPPLPNTGFNVTAGLEAGLLLLGAGAALRKARPR
jgi:LPXTG-motif cell wall-anchored protein